jgi:hypothetical protein
VAVWSVQRLFAESVVHCHRRLSILRAPIRPPHQHRRPCFEMCAEKERENPTTTLSAARVYYPRVRSAVAATTRPPCPFFGTAGFAQGWGLERPVCIALPHTGQCPTPVRSRANQTGHRVAALLSCSPPLPHGAQTRLPAYRAHALRVHRLVGLRTHDRLTCTPSRSTSPCRVPPRVARRTFMELAWSRAAQPTARCPRSLPCGYLMYDTRFGLGPGVNSGGSPRDVTPCCARPMARCPRSPAGPR